MQNLVIAAIILTLHLPSAHQPRLACTLRTTANGQRICFCRETRPGSRWQSYPRFFCTLTRR